MTFAKGMSVGVITMVPEGIPDVALVANLHAKSDRCDTLRELGEPATN